MEQKKPTKASLERRLRDAIVFVPKDRETKSFYFSDKGLRLTHTSDTTVIATGFHRHVFDNITMSGYSRPALYVERLIDIAIKENPVVEDAKGNQHYSFERLLKILEEKEDKTDYNIVSYVSWWLHLIFCNLYGIGENAATQFLCWYNYLHNIACQSVFLGEHKDGLTNKQFLEEYNKLMKEMLEGIEEHQIFEPLSDEQRMQQEIEALQEQNLEQNVEAN